MQSFISPKLSKKPSRCSVQVYLSKQTASICSREIELTLFISKVTWGLPLNRADFERCRIYHPPVPHAHGSCQALSQCGFSPGNLRMKKEELALPSSESRVEMEFFLSYFLFPISHPAVKYRIMQSLFRMCTWWIDQQFFLSCWDCKLLYTGLTLSKVWAISLLSQRSCFLHHRMKLNKARGRTADRKSVFCSKWQWLLCYR